MKTLSPVHVSRFKELFPELPAEVAEVVMQYAAGATQVDIVGIDGYPTRRQVEWMLNKTANILGLHSVPAIRTVVHNRLYFAIMERL